MSHIRQHTASPSGRCLWCGAAQAESGGWGERTCIERDDGITASEIRPEPARRQFAFEDFDAIGGRVAELKRERDAALNKPPEPEPTAALKGTDPGDCCY